MVSRATLATAAGKELEEEKEPLATSYYAKAPRCSFLYLGSKQECYYY